MNTRRRNYALFLTALSLIGLSAGFFFLSEEAAKTELTEQVKSVSLPEPQESAPHAHTQQDQTREIEEEFLTESLANQLGGFIDYYEAQARYPVFSIPVTDPNSIEIPAPFEQASVDTPIFDEQGNKSPLSIRAAVDKFQYTLGEPIALRVQLLGLEENQTIGALANIKRPGAHMVSAGSIELSQLNQAPGELTGVFDTNTFNSTAGFGDLIAAITVNIDGDSHVTTVPLRIHGKLSARLENLGVSHIEGAFLNIPLQFSVQQQGYYFIQGYLFEESSGRPLLSLQTEGSMGIGNQSLNLQAHIHALTDAGSTGPYSLKIHRAFRALEPGLNESNDVPVAVTASELNVPAFPFDNYTDTPYVDAMTQDRIEALRELTASSVTNTND